MNPRTSFKIASTLMSVLILSCSMTPLAAEVKQLATIVDAKPLARIPPKYPINEAKYRREGWTSMSYVIEPDGSVSNVVVEESSGRKSFEDAAIKAVKQWRFEPAMEHGKPVQQCQNSVQLNFAIDNNKLAVSRQFRSLYNQALEALNENKLAETATLLEKLQNLKQWRLSEQRYYLLLTADYAKKLGNRQLHLESLNHAFYAGGAPFPSNQELAILREKLQLELSFNYLYSALATYDKLLASAEAESYKEQLETEKNELAAFIAGDQNIVVNAELSQKDFWRHTLVRNSFSLLNIQGTISKLDVRCNNKRHVFTVADQHTWKIPEHWQQCSLYIYGEQDTTFQLVEIPATANTQTIATQAL